MHINSNMTAIITNNCLLRNESAFSLSTGKLSSGYKINTAGDDPTGYAISGRMRQQLAALERADVNATTGKSVLETADGALSEVTDMLQRLNELTIKASNGTMSASDRSDIQREVDQLTEEIERISQQIELNGQKLLDGHLENHGYSNDKSVKVVEYNEKVNAGEYKGITITETADENGLTVTVKNFPKTGAPDITIEAESLFNRAGNDDDKHRYPKYYDNESAKYVLDDPNLKAAITACRYDDNENRGSVKICEDGSQLITVRARNGEELTLSIDNRQTNPSTATKIHDGEEYKFETYSINLSIDLTLTGQGAMDLHIGANEEEMIECSLPEISLRRLDLDDLSVKTQASAQYSMERVTYALKYVSSARAQIGAYTNRVEHSISYLAASNENLSSAMSRIQDTDMAEEMTNYASQQILVQAATSMLAQANQAPQQALQLIQ